MCTGVLQLAASGNLPAYDWSAVVGRRPRQFGPVDAAPPRHLRLLSVSLPRGDGGARHTHTHAAMTTPAMKTTHAAKTMTTQHAAMTMQEQLHCTVRMLP